MNEQYSTAVGAPEQALYVEPVSRGELTRYIHTIETTMNEEATIYALEAKGIQDARHHQTLTEAQIESRDYNNAKESELKKLAGAAYILGSELNPPRQADDSDESFNGHPIDAADLEHVAGQLTQKAARVAATDKDQSLRLQNAADLAHSMAVRYDEVVMDMNAKKDVASPITVAA